MSTRQARLCRHQVKVTLHEITKPNPHRPTPPVKTLADYMAARRRSSKQ